MKLNIYVFERKTKEGRPFLIYQTKSNDKFVELRFTREVSTYQLSQKNTVYTVELEDIRKGRNTKGYPCYWVFGKFNVLNSKEYEAPKLTQDEFDL